jgi:hypothetical protein
MSHDMADKMSQMPEVGMSKDAPARPAEPTVYPAVHDIPPPRTSVVLTDMEQQKLESDLVAARDRQQTASGIPLASHKDKTAKAGARAKTDAAKTDRAKPDRTKPDRTKPATNAQTSY